jgi:hypothetical protein
MQDLAYAGVDAAAEPSINSAYGIWTNIANAQAQIACKRLGQGYHLISENEWLTLSADILDVPVNDIDAATPGLQLATSAEQLATSSVYHRLSTGNLIYNLVGSTTEWTDKQIRQTDNALAYSDFWQEYQDITAYNGVGDIEPPYGLGSANGVGQIKTGFSGGATRGFIRGFGGLYGLDLSHEPGYVAADLGFRCAK